MERGFPSVEFSNDGDRQVLPSFVGEREKNKASALSTIVKCPAELTVGKWNKTWLDQLSE